MEEDSYTKLLDYALRILTRKRYTSHEMQQKLKRFAEKYGLKPVEIMEKVLERLSELKYLDDREYARDYIADRIKFKPRGKFLLERELKLKGLEKTLIQDKLKEQEIDEAAVAINALNKKLKLWISFPIQKKREKAFRFLSSRGFCQDAIYKAINSCYDAAEE